MQTTSEKLPHPDLPADLEGGRGLDAVEAAEGTDGGAVIDGNAAEGVTGLDCVPAHRLPFGILFLIVLVVLNFVFEVLFVVAVDIEILLLQDEETMTEEAFLEVNKPLRVKGKAIIAGLEMEVRAC